MALPRLPPPGQGPARLPPVTAVLARAAVPDDAETLGRCHLECRREAYGDLVDPARLAPYLADVEGFVGRRRGSWTGPYPSG